MQTSLTCVNRLVSLITDVCVNWLPMWRCNAFDCNAGVHIQSQLTVTLAPARALAHWHGHNFNSCTLFDYGYELSDILSMRLILIIPIWKYIPIFEIECPINVRWNQFLECLASWRIFLSATTTETINKAGSICSLTFESANRLKTWMNLFLCVEYYNFVIIFHICVEYWEQ